MEDLAQGFFSCLVTFLFHLSSTLVDLGFCYEILSFLWFFLSGLIDFGTPRRSFSSPPDYRLAIFKLPILL